MPILALVIALVFSAFTNTQQSKFEDPLWYYTEDTVDDHNDATKYEPLAGQAGFCTGGSSVRCVIEAPEDGQSGLPDLNNITSYPSFKPATK